MPTENELLIQPPAIELPGVAIAIAWDFGAGAQPELAAVVIDLPAGEIIPDFEGFPEDPEGIDPGFGVPEPGEMVNYPLFMPSDEVLF